MIRKLFKFNGGVHPPQNKVESTQSPIKQAAIPNTLVLPLHQHIGESAEPCVAVGDRVLKGQKIAKAIGYVSAPVHAPTSGTITAIEERPIPHPSGLSDLCLIMETDGKDEWFDKTPLPNFREIDPSKLRNTIRNAGIVGLGGAGFPTYIKLNPTASGGKAIDTLILNGVECEPYITCDDMLMRERANEVICGAKIMAHALQAKHVVIAIEDNKPEAFAAIQQAAQDCPVELVQVPTLYPQGGEKQLIKVITGKECPSDGLPIQIGIVVHNVGTAAAVYRAIEHGEPLISRIVTVTGDGISQSQNYEVMFGTSFNALLEQSGGTNDNVDRIIMGGPMMGFALRYENVPIIKTTNCILAATKENLAPPSYTLPCIRCGSCADACPVNLLPQQLYWFSKAKEFDRAQDYNLFDCIECGCCSYVCPSNIPLVHYYRYAKTEIWAQERDKERADLAKMRHDNRQARMELEKAEKAKRAAIKKAALKAAEEEKKRKAEEAAKNGESEANSAVDADEQTKQDEIKAAIARAKAKKAQKKSAPKNTDQLTPAQLKKIEDAKARRALADKLAAEATANKEQ